MSETSVTAEERVDGWYATVSGTNADNFYFESDDHGPHLDHQSAIDAAFYHVAEQRVHDSADLLEYHRIIFYDWPNWSEHVAWLATAAEAAIVEWAQGIQTQEDEG
jgi:hypothetical protein